MKYFGWDCVLQKREEFDSDEYLLCKLKNTHLSMARYINVKPQARKPGNFFKSTTVTVTDNRNNRSGFKTAREYHILLKDRKHESSTEAGTCKKKNFNPIMTPSKLNQAKRYTHEKKVHWMHKNDKL